MITEQHTKECLSLAYVHALAGRAGVNLTTTRTHDYGIDGTFQPVKITESRRRVESGFPVDFQLKSTIAWSHENDNVVYDLEVTNYNDIVNRSEFACSLIIILLCLPTSDYEWLKASEDELILKHCCYWSLLKGPSTENESKKRIRIPRSNTLTPENLNEILKTERARIMRG